MGQFSDFPPVGAGGSSGGPTVPTPPGGLGGVGTPPGGPGGLEPPGAGGGPGGLGDVGGVGDLGRPTTPAPGFPTPPGGLGTPAGPGLGAGLGGAGLPKIPFAEEEPKQGKLKFILGSVLLFVIGILIGGAGMFFGGEWLGIIGEEKETADIVVTRGQAEQKINQLQQTVTEYEQAVGRIPDAKNKMQELAERAAAQGTIDQLETTLADMTDKQEEYAALQLSLTQINDRVAEAQGDLSRMQSEYTVVLARRDGLTEEVGKLESLVGRLEDANQRRQAVRDSVERQLSLLAIQIKESNPVVPMEYRREERLKKVGNLREKLAQSDWVYPELMGEFNDLYREQLELATTQRWFLVQLGVDTPDGKERKWAECVNQGLWTVYFRTLDGKNVGQCVNTSLAGVPDYQLVTEIGKALKQQIIDTVVSARPVDFEERVTAVAGQAVLAKKRTISNLFGLL